MDQHMTPRKKLLPDSHVSVRKRQTQNEEKGREDGGKKTKREEEIKAKKHKN